MDIDELISGMVIEQSIEDKTGRSLIERGTILDDFRIEYLQGKGVHGVYIRGDDPTESADPDALEKALPDKAKALIEKKRMEDRKGVILSQAVKERVCQGVQYLFENTDSERFDEAAHNVSDELVNAVLMDNAVALDLDMIKVSDEYTFKHSVDVATMALIIGKNYGLTVHELREIGISGLLHDLGKSRIPLEVLNKPGRLSDQEFAIMKKHSLFGYQILKEKNNFSDGILMGVLEHHEKINGNGYPLKMPGNQIHKYARIISVADVFDALVTERPYKSAFSKRDAVEMIMSMTQEMDIDAMKSFLDTIILYPVDSIVHLSTGEYAKVVANVPDYVLRPVVVGMTTGQLYDLSRDVNCASVIIDG